MRKRLSGRASRLLVVGMVAGVVLGISTAVATADENPQPIDFTHNAVDAPAPVPGTEWSNGPNVKTGTAICTTATSAAANVNTDCEENGPHNESSIAVNPQNPDNMIGGLNDYQLSLNPGGHVGEQVLSRAHVTFDGGQTWSEYPLYSSSTYQATGDPSVAFDADGHAYYATLGFRFVGPGNVQNPDVLVGNSADGGRTWDMHRVAAGSGVATSVGANLDKEYVAAWGHGNAIVTFGDFSQVQKGVVVSANIYDSVTHDGGKTWSAPTKISDGLDESFGSVPAVTADGRIFVSFLNTPFSRLTDPTAADFGRDDYMLQEVDPQSGAPIGDPVNLGEVFDGNWDFPWNPVDFRPTYQDSLFRTWSFGNVATDPTNADHLAVVWADMRNSAGTPPLSFADPYSVTTNSDVVVTESNDGGTTWSTPTAIHARGDQFMSWAAFDSSGRLRIGYFDRSYDANNHMYGYTVATETSPGVFSTAQATTVLSDPTTNDRWFARTANSGFPRATAFLGDYSNIAATPDGGVVAYWTDMRNVNCWPSTSASCGRHGEDGYFAAMP